MERQHVLLSVGSEPDLLLLRNQVLRGAGYYVNSQTNIDEALRVFRRGDFDLVIMCHSVPEADKVKLITAIRKSRPSTPIVIVRRDGESTSLADGSVHSLDGVNALLNCVSELLERRRQSA